MILLGRRETSASQEDKDPDKNFGDRISFKKSFQQRKYLKKESYFEITLHYE